MQFNRQTDNAWIYSVKTERNEKKTKVSGRLTWNVFNNKSLRPLSTQLLPFTSRERKSSWDFFFLEIDHFSLDRLWNKEFTYKKSLRHSGLDYRLRFLIVFIQAHLWYFLEPRPR